MNREERFMREALLLAKEAEKLGEAPVGAVVVKDDIIVGTGFNKREFGKNALYHAETEAINNACKNLGGWRLWQCELFVTLEPCPMCAGAIINARIPRVYFGAYDKKNGSCGSVLNLFEYPYTHKPSYVGGILQDECADILSKFFAKLRKKQ